MSASRRLDQPEVGHWLVRLVKGGPLVPARIIRAHTTHDPLTGEPMDRSPHWHAEIAGKVVDIEAVWHRRGEPITEAEYDDRMKSPSAAPTDRRVDHMTVALPF